MNRLQDSSEIREASLLIADLLKPGVAPENPEQPSPARPAEQERKPQPPAGSGDRPQAGQPTETGTVLQAPAAVLHEEVLADIAAEPALIVPLSPQDTAEILAPQEEDQPARFRGDKLENVLAAMCKRSGFTGAVVADSKGLPLAVFNSPVGADAIAAFTTVLGGALEKAGTLLGQHGAETISMDINYTDKVVLRLFRVDDKPYFMMVLCPQRIDERSEIELSIKQIVGILTEA